MQAPFGGTGSRFLRVFSREMEVRVGAAIDAFDGRGPAGLRLRGTAHVPGDDGYDEGRQAFNLNARQEPALVVMAEAAEDIVAAVRLAKEQGLGVGVLATGHGVANPCDGGVLVNTSRMRGVSVDADSRTARVEPGALWSDVLPRGPDARADGARGLLLRGRRRRLHAGRRLRLAGAQVRVRRGEHARGRLVTADGESVKASADENADLFWGLKGSGGQLRHRHLTGIHPLSPYHRLRRGHLLPGRESSGSPRPLRWLGLQSFRTR